MVVEPPRYPAFALAHAERGNISCAAGRGRAASLSPIDTGNAKGCYDVATLAHRALSINRACPRDRHRGLSAVQQFRHAPRS